MMWIIGTGEKLAKIVGEFEYEYERQPVRCDSKNKFRHWSISFLYPHLTFSVSFP